MAFDLTAFRKSRVYTTRDTAANVAHDLSVIRRLDRRKEKLQRQYEILAGIFGVLLAAAFPLGGGLGSLWVWVVLALSAFLVIAFVLRAVHKSLNLENRRYELLDGLLRLLGADMAEDAAVDVALDLRAPNHKSKFQRKGQVKRKWGSSWNVNYFKDPWLRLRGRLLDGTRFQVLVTEKHQDRSRWKTSSSGKKKRKTKTKASTEAAVILRMKEGRYGPLDSFISELGGAVKLPPWAETKRLEGDSGSLKLESQTSAAWDVTRPRTSKPASGPDGVAWISMMFLSLYQGLNLARRIGKTESSKEGGPS